MEFNFKNVVVSPEEFEEMLNGSSIVQDNIEQFKHLFKDKTDPVHQVQELVDKGADLDNYHWKNHLWKGRGTGVKLVQNTYVQVSDNTTSNVLTYDEKEIHVGDTIDYYMEVGMESRWYVCLVGHGYELLSPAFRPGWKLDEGSNYAAFLSEYTYDPSKMHRNEYEV